MLGSFGRVFSREYKNEQMSKHAYDNAKGYRKRRLVEFRRNAMQRVFNAEYDWPKFLISMHCPSFMAYSLTKKQLVLGVFADNLFPELPFIGDDDTAERRMAAVKDFTAKVYAFDRMGPQDFIGEIRANGFGNAMDMDNYVSSIIGNGYAILKVVHDEEIARGMVLKDKECIAFADCWTEYEIGDFVKNLNGAKSHFSTSDIEKIAELSFRIDFENLNTRNYFVVTTFFYENYLKATADEREEFEVFYASLIEFVDEIEMSICGAEASDALVRSKYLFDDLLWRGKEPRAFSGYID